MKYIFLFIFLFYLFIYLFFIIIFRYAIAYLRTGSYAPDHHHHVIKFSCLIHHSIWMFLPAIKHSWEVRNAGIIQQSSQRILHEMKEIRE